MTSIATFTHERGGEETRDPDRLSPLPPSHGFARVLGFAPLLGPRLLGLDASLHQQGFVSHSCGVAVHHPHTLLGLRLWRDCEETAHDTLYELEKILRMLLRQSVLAADIFLSVDPVSSLDTSWLFSNAMTHEFAVALLQRARRPIEALVATREAGGACRPADVLPALLDVATCASLSCHTLYTRHVPTLLDLEELAQIRDIWRGLDPSRDALDALVAPLHELFVELSSSRPFLNSLPRRPLGYDALHDFLVEQRMEASNRP